MVSILGVLLVLGIITTAGAFTIHDIAGNKITITAPQLDTSTMGSSTMNDFSISSTSIQTVLSGTPSGTTTVQDVVYNYYNSGSVLNSCSVEFFEQGGFPAIISSVYPSIATIDQNGNVTYVSNGTAQFNVTIGNRTKGVLCQILETTNQYSTVYNSIVPTSTAGNIISQINGLISGLTPSTTTEDIYSATDDTDHIYTRNPDVFTGNVNLTSIPAAGLNGFSGILVAPDIMINAWHTNYYNGYPQNAIYTNPYLSEKIYFVDKNNNVYSSTIANEESIGGTDIAVLHLTTPMPPSITPADVFASTTFFHNISSAAITQEVIPAIVTNQSRTLGIRLLQSVKPIIGPDTYIVQLLASQNGVAPPSWPYANWYYGVVNGDSGSPAFTIVNGTLVALGNWTGGDNMPDLSYYTSQINSIMTALGSSYQLTTVNLSGFPSY